MYLKVYFEELNNSFADLIPYMSVAQKCKLERDLETKGEFLSPSFYQAACETTICSYFARKFPTSFMYEPEVCPPKNFDCSFLLGGTRINLEVKCPDYSQHHEIAARDGIKLRTSGRISSLPVVSEIAGLLGELSSVEKVKNFDNKLKDYLLSTHSKSSEKYDDGVNVLLLCGNDAQSLNDYAMTLIGNKGLFTRSSFSPVSDFEKVDLVPDFR